MTTIELELLRRKRHAKVEARKACEDFLGCAVESARELELSWQEFLALAVEAWRTKEF
jgi:hypothetical protein